MVGYCTIQLKNMKPKDRPFIIVEISNIKISLSKALVSPIPFDNTRISLLLVSFLDFSTSFKPRWCNIFRILRVSRTWRNNFSHREILNWFFYSAKNPIIRVKLLVYESECISRLEHYTNWVLKRNKSKYHLQLSRQNYFDVRHVVKFVKLFVYSILQKGSQNIFLINFLTQGLVCLLEIRFLQNLVLFCFKKVNAIK